MIDHDVSQPPDEDRTERRADRGAVLPMVLIFLILSAFIVIPLLTYAITVMRQGSIQSDKTEAVELARGGTWVALHNQADLYDLCVGGTLPSSIDDVATTCEVLRVEQLRPIEKVPFHMATVLADTQVPAEITTSEAYINPNTAADPTVWITNGDATVESEAGKVWLPELPVQATSGGGTRDTTMLPGTQDPSYTSCRVLFPGTFTSPLTFDGPTYLTSGVYYFTESITIENGADVVVGGGSEIGCTTDFEAIASATVVPDPLNMSGLGGTIVLGGEARIVVDDSVGTGDVRFVINRRYVSDDETSVQASGDVSIISVNGAHQPYYTGQSAGDAFDVAGSLYVPASTVDTDGNPFAALEGYDPSVHSYRPEVPDAPVVTAMTDWQVAENDSADDGRLTIEWTEPAANGSRITGYTATDLTSGLSCSPPAPTAPDYTVQTSCTIVDHPGHSSSGPHAEVVVVATNDMGDSDASAQASGPRVDLTGSTESPEFARPTEPLNLAVANDYSDGIEISWDTPASDGGSPIASYRVTITEVPSGTVLGQCVAWFDETSCVTPLGPSDGPNIEATVEALHIEGDPAAEYAGTPATLTGISWTPSGSPTPADPAVPALVVDPDPILDFATESGNQVDIVIEGYIAVPQGKVTIGAVDPSATDVQLTGGLLAARIVVDEGGSVPAALLVEFDNPDAQKQVRIRSEYSGGRVSVTSEAIVQINKSGSLGINSWVVGDTGSITSVTNDGGASATTTTTTTDPAATTTTTTAPTTTTTAAPTTTTTTTTVPPTTTTTTVPPTTTTVPPTNDGTTHPTIVGDSGAPIGNHPERDYCNSGVTWWSTDFGDGWWLAEYWSFNSSTNRGNYGADIFSSAPSGYRYLYNVYEDYGYGDGPLGTSNYWAARYTATLNVPDNCTLWLAPGGDDGYALYVNGTRVAEDWGDHGFTYDAQPIALQPGENLVVMEYYEATGDQFVGLWWTMN